MRASLPAAEIIYGTVSCDYVSLTADHSCRRLDASDIVDRIIDEPDLIAEIRSIDAVIVQERFNAVHKPSTQPLEAVYNIRLGKMFLRVIGRNGLPQAGPGPVVVRNSGPDLAPGLSLCAPTLTRVVDRLPARYPLPRQDGQHPACRVQRGIEVHAHPSARHELDGWPVPTLQRRQEVDDSFDGQQVLFEPPPHIHGDDEIPA